MEILIKKDDKILKNNEPQTCLFWRIEKYDEKDYKNIIGIKIRKITSKEWSETIDDYLWLVTKIKKLCIIKGGDGDIILNKDFKNRIYSRGVYVINSEYDMEFGYNVNLDLDRDRSCIPNYSNLFFQARKIIWHILDNYNNFKNGEEKDKMVESERKIFDEFPKKILEILEKEPIPLFLDGHFSLITQKGADLLWELNAKIKKKKKEKGFFNENGTEIKFEDVPQPLNNIEDLKDFIWYKRCDESFYNYFETTKIIEIVLNVQNIIEVLKVNIKNLKRN